MEKSFARLAGFEHEAEMLGGYDGLVTCVNDGLPLTADATYTHSVLKLHAQDEGVSVSGQEGFLDSIKRGASKIYEWIKSIIRAIRNWFTGGSKGTYDAARKELERKNSKDWATKQVAELKSKGIDAVMKENGDHGFAVLSKMSVGERTELDKAYEEAANEFNASVDGNEIITDKMIDDVINKISVKISQVKTHINEIERVDPEFKSFKILGVPHWEYSNDYFDKNAQYTDGIKHSDFFKEIKELLRLAGNAQADLDTATRNLDKYNIANRNSTDRELPRILSRSGVILKELAEIASIYRELIITVNTQMDLQYKKAERSILKSTFLLLRERTGMDADRYRKLTETIA